MSDDVAARRRWAYRMIRRCPEPPPLYGSAAWLALPEGSPARVAAVVRAAEAWAQCGDELEAELRTELDLAWRAHKAAEDAEYQAQAAAHRERWSHLPLTKPTYAGQDVEPLEIIGRRYMDQRRRNRTADSSQEAS